MLKDLPDSLEAPNAFDGEPAASESLGCKVYTYTVDDCTELIIYANPETDNVARAIIRSNSKNMETTNAETFGIYAALLTSAFVSNDEIDDMDESLAIADTPYTEDTINFYHGSLAELSYTITDGLLWVRISPTEDKMQGSSADGEPIEEGKPTPLPSSMTSGQQNALSLAKSYLLSSSFSYTGLVSQLEYENVSHDDAVFAVDNCGADWNEQALKSASSYLNSSAFSYSGLISQLEHSGFTTEQATYGADNCNADWNEQATKKASSYLRSGSYNRERLIHQLEYSGFTHDQAVYGVEQNGL